MSTTEEKIIQAAIKEFSKHGFAGARVDRIAKKARVNKAMIYYHFKSKEKLYEFVLMIFAKGIFTFVQNHNPDGKADINELFSILSMYIEYFCKLNPDLIKIILSEAASGGKYLRKVIFPIMIEPLFPMWAENIGREINNKAIWPVNPYYTLIQIIGGVVFLNILKIGLYGTDLYKFIYNENYIDEFRQNLIEILKHGIVKESKQ